MKARGLVAQRDRVTAVVPAGESHSYKGHAASGAAIGALFGFLPGAVVGAGLGAAYAYVGNAAGAAGDYATTQSPFRAALFFLLREREREREREALLLTRHAVETTRRRSRSFFAGAVAGGCVAGPPGLVLGGAAGVLGQGYADATYVGDPARWTAYEQLARRGRSERDRGCGLGASDEGALLAAAAADEGSWLARRDAATTPALRDLLALEEADEELPFRIALCGSGGGLRAATAFLGLLAEAERNGLLAATTF